MTSMREYCSQWRNMLSSSRIDRVVYSSLEVVQTHPLNKLSSMIVVALSKDRMSEMKND